MQRRWRRAPRAKVRRVFRRKSSQSSKSSPAHAKGRRVGFGEIAASPKTGINTIACWGLKHAMTGTQVVIDLAIHFNLKTRRCWNFSKPQAATFSRRRPQPAFLTPSHARPSSWNFLGGIADSSANGKTVRLARMRKHSLPLRTARRILLHIYGC
jgi:hypothetical protein